MLMEVRQREPPCLSLALAGNNGDQKHRLHTNLTKPSRQAFQTVARRKNSRASQIKEHTEWRSTKSRDLKESSVDRTLFCDVQEYTSSTSIHGFLRKSTMAVTNEESDNIMALCRLPRQATDARVFPRQQGCRLPVQATATTRAQAW